MAGTVYFDSSHDDATRRSGLYSGELYVFSPRKSVQDLIAFTRGMIEKAFSPLDPETAQFEMPVDEYAALLAQLKPAFIHHPESKRLLRVVLEDFGCDPTETYFDVPRLRSSTSDNFLTTGIAYAWHPHRDTWYSAPLCQLNWWLPVYELSDTNAMAFHPNYWNCAVANTSADYNYYVWNQQHRGPEIAQLTKEDPRPLPRAAEPLQLEPQLRLICPVGGMIIFSGAHMHSSIPNTSGKTRFSIDFRTVNARDARKHIGAPRTDEFCTGTTMRDYLRCTDLSRIPDDLVASYDDGTVAYGDAIYRQA